MCWCWSQVRSCGLVARGSRVSTRATLPATARQSRPRCQRTSIHHIRPTTLVAPVRGRGGAPARSHDKAAGHARHRPLPRLQPLRLRYNSIQKKRRRKKRRHITKKVPAPAVLCSTVHICSLYIYWVQHHRPWVAEFTDADALASLSTAECLKYALLSPEEQYTARP